MKRVTPQMKQRLAAQLGTVFIPKPPAPAGGSKLAIAAAMGAAVAGRPVPTGALVGHPGQQGLPRP